jgi:hypothetical protein
MPTAEQVKDLTRDKIEAARDQAEAIVSTSAEQASTHRLRTTLVVGLIVLVAVVVLRKMMAHEDEQVSPGT